MIVDDLRWLWKMSALVCRHENPNAMKTGIGAARVLRRRLYFVAKSSRLMNSLQVYMYPRPGCPLQRVMEQRPELVGVTIWPYICSSWNAKTCLQRIDEHFRAIEQMDSILDFPVNDMLPLLGLEDMFANLRVVLDQPKWLMRDGLFAINLFLLENRIYSLVFSFGFEESRIIAYIGGIQGVDIEGILDDYKDLTKALHGMRPRDFLVEVFRIFCRNVGITKIYAVNDEKRHLRSRYFGTKKSKQLFLNYNDVWMERGGVPSNEDFFALSVEAPLKDLDEVPSKKRAMYRRRYELLRSVEDRMQVSLKAHVTNQFL